MSTVGPSLISKPLVHRWFGDGSRLTHAGFRYRTIAVGGTFDVLHAGHEKLLSVAFGLGELVLIGVSSDRLVSSLSKHHLVRPFDVRVRELRRFLKSHGWLGRARIIELRDPLGPAVRRKRLEALVVSEETRPNAVRLNRIRRRRGLRPLRVHVIGLVRAQDEKPISATRVRRGEIDAQGRLKTESG